MPFSLLPTSSSDLEPIAHSLVSACSTDALDLARVPRPATVADIERLSHERSRHSFACRKIANVKPTQLTFSQASNISSPPYRPAEPNTPLLRLHFAPHSLTTKCSLVIHDQDADGTMSLCGWGRLKGDTLLAGQVPVESIVEFA